MPHRILIIDFGAQYTQLIARRVRELGVYCEIHPWDISDAEVRAFGARGVILSGGPESVTDSEPPRAPQAVFELGRAGAGHLLWHADHGAAARRPRCRRPHTRVRLCGGPGGARLQAARWHPGSRAGRARCARRVDEPWRSRGSAAAGLCCGCQDARCALCRHGGRATRVVRCAVPPGGHAHAPGRGDPGAFRARDLRLRGALDRRQHHRRPGGAHPGAGRQRAGTAGAVGRCRFLGGRGAAAAGDRRPADLRVRRSWPAAPR